MKDIIQTETIKVPEKVTVQIKGRIVNVEGPRGKLVRDLHHVPVDIKVLKSKKGGDIVHIAIWHGLRKHVACLRTVKSCIQNLIKGVTVVRWLETIAVSASPD